MLPETDFSSDKKPHLFLYKNYVRHHLGVGEGLVNGTFRIWGPVPGPRGEAKNPEGIEYKTFSYMKSSSNFLSISFGLLFCDLSALLPFMSLLQSKLGADLLRHLNAIAWQWSGSLETPQCDSMAMERISQGTRTTLTGCMDPAKKKMKKKRKDEIKNCTFQISEGPVTGWNIRAGR